MLKGRVSMARGLEGREAVLPGRSYGTGGGGGRREEDQEMCDVHYFFGEEGRREKETEQ